MFLDVTQQERDAFIRQNDGCLIPGYTGHCPTLKFRFGKPYGANTKEAIQELRETPPRPEPYRHNDPHKTVLVPITCEKVQTEDYDSHLNRKSQRYILGYTGYIPGLHFRYGNSFQRAAYESFIDFGRRLAEEDQRREREKRSYRSQSAPRTRIRSRESVKKTLDQACPKHKSYNCSHISAEFPPIAGYTGHIPRLRVTDTALSQRYGTAVRQGLTLLQQEREKRGRN